MNQVVCTFYLLNRYFLWIFIHFLWFLQFLALRRIEVTFVLTCGIVRFVLTFWTFTRIKKFLWTFLHQLLTCININARMDLLSKSVWTIFWIWLRWAIRIFWLRAFSTFLMLVLEAHSIFFPAWRVNWFFTIFLLPTIKLRNSALFFIEEKETFKQSIKSLFFTDLWIDNLVFKFLANVVFFNIKLEWHIVFFLDYLFPLYRSKPFMPFNLIETFQPFVHVAFNKTDYQIFKLFRSTLVKSQWLIIIVRRYSENQLISKASQSIEIYRVVVSLLCSHLWSHILFASTVRIS